MRPLLFAIVFILTCGFSCQTPWGSGEHEQAPDKNVGSGFTMTIKAYGTAADIAAARAGTGFKDLQDMSKIYRAKAGKPEAEDGDEAVTP